MLLSFIKYKIKFINSYLSDVEYRLKLYANVVQIIEFIEVDQNNVSL
jgi:hypothetical protein